MLDLIAQRLVNPQIIDPIRNFNAEGYINRLIPILIYLGFAICAIAFMLLLIIGGTQWIMAGGNKQSLESARNKIVNAITGLIILFLLWLILQLVNAIFGINIGRLGNPYIAPPVPIVVDGTCASSGPGLCDCSCPSGYHQASVCSAACTGACRCVSDSLPPGTCQCENGVPSQDICNDPYVAVCSGPTGCSCLVPPYPPGFSCESSNVCAGFCGSTDLDNDGFHAEGGGVCMAGIPDCNDNNNLVFPGQTQYFQDPIGASLNDFNYDCADGDGDGDPNDRWPRLNCLSAEPHFFTCQLTPIDESIIRPLTGWQNFIPACGANLSGSGVNRFYMCSASHYNNCTANPMVVDEVGCFTTCLTGNNCGWSEDTACISWSVAGWPPFSSYFTEDFPPSGLTRMPCK